MAKHLHSQYFVKSIAIKQLKEKVNSLIGLRLPTMPKQGWVRTIREALDMSGAQLGARLGISRNKISILERKEADGSITINQGAVLDNENYLGWFYEKESIKLV
ncbi:helix-turn-helix domain-containing protein [Vibrio rumoiensis]|uniref:hypothetical protein n=1 Tax=Vibrio rumoiensis TaxID=76258 RepID=UPI000B5CFCD2|nr:hypothetical protein [Vibrio rumoiensis]